jgi:outer membrane protein assembly factor BamB
MRKQLFLGLAGGIGVLWGVVSRADWPHYRGPNHDGSAATTIRTNWTSNAPRELWRIPLGPGWSSFAAGGGRLFTQVRRTQGGSEREFAVALNPDTGETLWSTELGRAQYGNLVGYDDNLDGPRSTPTVAGDRVFILTSQMVLFCLRADTGAVIWRRDFIADLGASNIPWESAACPLVVGGMVVVNCNAPSEGSFLAASTGDGRTMWRSGSDGATHASPVLAQLHGEAQVVFVTLSGLVGLNPQTGASRWRLPFSPSTTSTAASPVVSGEYVYASAAYGRGAWTARVTATGTAFAASEAWRQRGDQYQNHWATAVAYEGHL